MIRVSEYQSPCGKLMVGSINGRLCLCDWIGAKDRDPVLRRMKRYLNCDIEKGSSKIIDETVRQLEEYFKGERLTFEVPILTGGTDFQHSVWGALQAIPYGDTRTYSEIAQLVGKPKAVRAVANAIGANALSIIIPCHRVIGSGNSLTGYAGGLQAKQFLLSLEADNISQSLI